MHCNHNSEERCPKAAEIKQKKCLKNTEGLVFLTLTVTQFDDVEDERGKLLIRNILVTQ